MLSVNKVLGRTVHYNNFTFYSIDGFGRDGYITYNNGGYWKDNLKGIMVKPKYPLNSKPVLQSLGRIPPPVRYHSDGSGRDSYVVDRAGGLVRNFTPLNQIPLSYYLRHSNTTNQVKHMTFYTQKECHTNSLLNKIQNDVVNRLFPKDKRRFVLLKNKREVEMLNNVNLFNPIFQKSQSTNSFINNAKSINLINRPNIIFSPSSKCIMPVVNSNKKPKYTTILHNPQPEYFINNNDESN